MYIYIYIYILTFKVSYIFSYFPWLQCAKQEVLFLFLQNICGPVVVSYKLELGILFNYSESFPAFQNKEAALERCSTKVAVRQNVVMKYNSSAPVLKSRKALHTTLQKTAIRKKKFFKEVRTAVLKNTSRWLLLGTINFWQHSWMASSER